MSSFRSVTQVDPYGESSKVLLINSDGEAYEIREVLSRAGDYTFSVWRKGEGVTFSVFGELEYVPASPEWVKYVRTVTVTDTTNNSIYIRPDSNANVYLFEAYCTAGAVDTSWQPAPEDVDEGIDKASKVATNFVSTDNLGMMVYDGTSGTHTPTNPGANTSNVLIDSDSVDIRQGTDILATFGSPTRIGREDSSNLEITPYELVFNTPEVESAVAILPIPSASSSISQGGVIKFGAEDYGEASSITGQKNTDGSSNLDIEGFYRGSTGHSSVVSMKSRHQDANGVDIDEARMSVGCNEPLVELSATDYNSNKSSSLRITPDDGVETDNKITVMGHSSAIGTIKSVTPPSSVTVPTSTPSAISSITLDEGTWIITANVRFPAMGTNSAVVYANISPTAGDTALQYRAPSEDSIVAIQLTYIAISTADAKPFYLNVYHSSGSNKSFSTANTLRAVRIA